jgi:hypothetical protein
MNVDITLGFCDSGSNLVHKIHTTSPFPVSYLGENKEEGNINFDI